VPHETLPFHSEGAIVDLLIGVSQPRRERLIRNQFPIPAKIRVKAQIDTGAEISAINEAILAPLELPVLDTRPVRTVATSRQVSHFNFYVVSIGIPHVDLEMHLPKLEVMACVFGEDEEARALIGRDLLAHCLFAYDGSAGTFALSF
jgi:hypothetical protein